MKNNEILYIDTKKLSTNILILFVSTEFLFLIFDITINYNKLIHYGPMRRLFNIAREDSLSSWFMSAQTLITALVLWLIVYIHLKLYTSGTYVKVGWFILAIFFTYMAADDGAAIHERLGSTFELLARDAQAGNMFYFINSFPSYIWQIVVLPFFAAMGIFMLVFLWKIFRLDMMMYKILLAFSFLGIAVILDFMEGLSIDSAYNIYNYVMDVFNVNLKMVEHFSRAIEELFEMIGITLFLVVFIEYIGKIREKPIKIYL